MKTFCFFSAAFSVFCVPFFASEVWAHELIPAAVQEFLSQNPNATPQEIEAFVRGSAPQLASKFKNIDQLLTIVRNRNTSFLDNVWDFLRLGVEHIVSGWDHILFVLSLLLAFRSWRDILKLTATFTLAHSITLILAGASILTLSSRVVEPIIAFSISYVAFATVFLPGTRLAALGRHKASIVFFFGLFHGLGFAGLLKEIQIPAERFVSSLFSFNFGIEVGQLAIVALALPFVVFARTKQWYPVANRVAASVLVVVGLVWGIQRIFF